MGMHARMSFEMVILHFLTHFSLNQFFLFLRHPKLRHDILLPCKTDCPMKARMYDVLGVALVHGCHAMIAEMSDGREARKPGTPARPPGASGQQAYLIESVAFYPVCLSAL